MAEPEPDGPIYMVNLLEFEDRAAMLAMSTSKEWQEISVHREAGLAGQLNIDSVVQAGSPDPLNG